MTEHEKVLLSQNNWLSVAVEKLQERMRVQSLQIQSLMDLHKDAAEIAEKSVYPVNSEDCEERQYLYSVPWKMVYGNTIVTNCEREAFIASFQSPEIAFYILSMHNVNLTFKQAIENANKRHSQ